MRTLAVGGADFLAAGAAMAAVPRILLKNSPDLNFAD
jgi:hypothetical protein